MSYIQNPTSNLKNAIDELARKYGKEFNGDVNAFVEASKHASTNGGVDNYLEQVFDMASRPIPTPTIEVSDITNVSADGVTNATTTVTITDGDGWNVAVTTDGTIVTTASLNNTTLTYTVAMNSSTERSGSITITLSMSGQEDVAKTISVTQNAYIAPTVEIGQVSEAPAAGGTFSTTLTITNGDGWIKVIQRDANVITSASISGSTLTYTIGENTAYNTRSTTLSVVLMKANRTQVSDSVTITQQAAEQPSTSGVFIYYTDGTRSNYNVLDSGKTPVGVLLITDDVSFIVHPTEGSSKQWSVDTSTLISGVTTTSDAEIALLDTAGAANTAAVIASGLAGSAFTFATDAVYADGRTGFLPACGQMEAMRLNETNINTAMNLIGGTQLDYSSRRYLSSTQTSTAGAWIWRNDISKWKSTIRDTGRYCRSVATYSTDTPLQWIKFTQGGYVDTGVPFEPGDRVYLKFKLHNTKDCTLLGAGEYINGSIKNNMFFNSTQYKLMLTNRLYNESANREYIVAKNGEIDIETLYEFDFDFSKTSQEYYLINNSYSWINSITPGYNPNASTVCSLYINSWNIGGMSYADRLGVHKTNDITIYEFKLTDRNGVVKCDIVPVLVSGVPKFKDTVSGTYIEVSADNGYTPVITYA